MMMQPQPEMQQQPMMQPQPEMQQQPIMQQQPMMQQPMMQQPMYAQPMMAPAPAPQTNTNTNTNVNVVVGGGGSNKEKKEGPFPFELPQFPCKGSCPQCKEYVTTAVVRRWSCLCWIIFVTFFLISWWIAICCICSNEGNKTSFHRCPRCGLKIGKEGDSPVVMGV